MPNIIVEDPKEKYRAWGLKTLGLIMRDADITPDQLINPYGCTGLFDPCGDGDLVSLAMCGADPLMDALGWRANNVCKIIKQYLTWIGPAAAVGMNPGEFTPDGIVEECCEPRKTVAWNTCEWEMEGFGHLGNSGGAVCLWDDMKECEGQPDRFLLDGSPIESNLHFRSIVAAEVILQTLRWMLKNGNATQKGHFDGLDRVITTGVLDRKGNPCPALDSFVINWAGGCFAEAGAEWSDARGTVALPEGYSIIDTIWNLYRHQSRRRSMSPMLSAQTMLPGDAFLVGSPETIECLRMCNVCHTMCSGGDDCDIQVTINNRESREYYVQLVTGQQSTFGYGYLYHKGTAIPYMESNLVGNDLYLLWRKVGNVPLLWMEYQDADSLDLGRIPGNHFRTSDGGRFLHYTQTKETCAQEVMDFRPRMRYDGRWMQARITGFECADFPRRLPVCDPWHPDFYIPGPLQALTA